MEWDKCSLYTFLAADPRPTCVFGIPNDSPATAPVAPVYANPAFEKWRLRSVQPVADLLSRATGHGPASFPVGDEVWHGFTIGDRYRALACQGSISADASGDDVPVAPAKDDEKDGQRPPVIPNTNVPVSETNTNGVSPPLLRQQKIIDWTQFETEDMSPYIRFLKDYDWSKTVIGPISEWSKELRLITVRAVSNPDPRLWLFGPQLAVLYNEAMFPLIGTKHPVALGMPAELTFGEIWEHVQPLVHAAFYDGETSKVSDMPLVWNRHGFQEETFWTFTISPILSPNGMPAGVLDELVESTNAVIGERRMNTLLKLAESVASAASRNEVWLSLEQALKWNVNDVPCALVYSWEIAEAPANDASDRRAAMIEAISSSTLKGCVGYDKPHAPSLQSLCQNDDFKEQLFLAAAKESPVILNVSDETLPHSLRRSFFGRAGSAPLSQAVIIPIYAHGLSASSGLLVLGLTPRRPYDAEYETFIRLLHERLNSAIAFVSLPEKQRRFQAFAEESSLKHAALSRQLILRSQEVKRSEARFEMLGDHSPLGIFVLSENGTPIYCNDAYFRLTGLDPGDQHNFESSVWRETIFPEDLKTIEHAWFDMVNVKRPTTVEYRLKNVLQPTNGAPDADIEHTWLRVSMFPELNEDGAVQTIHGWTEDISLQKWTAQLQERRLEQAVENRRQTENFIDIVSHEMRNPLSAIVQCAESITTILNVERRRNRLSEVEIDTVLDSAQTIGLCAQHQTRIINDVLTVSKLDASLLTLSPEAVRPLDLAREVLRMYETELVTSDITAQIKLDDSYGAVGMNEAYLDKGRLFQVLINLFTNSIKFVRGRDIREINIHLGASSSLPTSDLMGNGYLPARALEFKTIASLESETKEIYLLFTIEDTGKGLSETEMSALFRKFQQGSPKTYSRYGGSGLGLFISKELVELQGGRIGVASQEGVGSTFSFFIKALAPRRISVSNEVRIEAVGLPACTQEVSGDVPSSKDAVSITSGQRQASPPEAKSVPEGHTSSLSSDKIHVLLVEDNLINQQVTAKQLKRVGHEVHVANHGLEALLFLQKTDAFNKVKHPAFRSKDALPLSLVLMDIEMPVMDGLTCIERIRESQIRHLPCIALTANARSEQKTNALAHGFDAVVTKPFRVTELIFEMERLLEGARDKFGPQ